MILEIRAKKSLGQHFLTDKNIAKKIAESLLNPDKLPVIEIGAGTGILSGYLAESTPQLTLVEIDKEAVSVLQQKFKNSSVRILQGDFLKLDFENNFHENSCIIGNLPYNISSQIFFRVIENRDLIPEVVCMIQKEVAQRIASNPGNKTYGILSVLLQAWYNIDYLFTVNETVFNPPPKVKSAVIRLRRNSTNQLPCNEEAFFKVVKAAFNQRRKTLRNALKLLGTDTSAVPAEILDNRAEKLNVEQFAMITKILYG